MAKLAIRGHESRGKEVIEILEMLGGKNDGYLDGINESCWYFIDENNLIVAWSANNTYSKFTLEQFLDNFPYKVGDRVIADMIGETEIVSMKWRETDNEVYYKVKVCDVLYTVDCLQPYENDMNIAEAMKQITDAAETLVASTQQYGFRTSDGDITDESKIVFKKNTPNKTELVLGDDFEVVVEDGKTYVVRKQPQYPKTYEECCKILFPNSIELGKVLTSGYNCELLKKFGELLIFRDAYWKLAGDWKPDWESWEDKFCITIFKNKLHFDDSQYINRILVFPTEEIRDTFYENFKALIEACKELL